MKSAMVVGLLTVSLLGLAIPVSAQQCVGSWLMYIVRDEKGAAVDAASDSFTLSGGAESRSWDRSWSGNREGAFSGPTASALPSDLLAEVRGRIAPLALGSMGTAGGCVFTNGATLSLTMGGKTMNLAFGASWRCCDSHTFVIDGLPFREGRFEIALTVPGVSPQHEFFPASAWKLSP
jgi:hypothetical protein